MEAVLYDRAIALLRRGTPLSRDVVTFDGGVSIVHALGEPSRLSFILGADRDHRSRSDAEAAGRDLERAVVADEPPLAGRLSWSVEPRSATATIHDEAAAEATFDAIAKQLTAHEADCSYHRDARDRFFLSSVEGQVGWTPDEDHLLVWFCVDGSLTSKEDDACAMQAVDALARSSPSLPPVRWMCTPYR